MKIYAMEEEEEKISLTVGFMLFAMAVCNRYKTKTFNIELHKRYSIHEES